MERLLEQDGVPRGEALAAAAADQKSARKQDRVFRWFKTWIAEGLFIDHGMGVVIGETSVVGKNVTLFQGVTLGGTGKETGDRHPKVRRGVLIGAGAKILGNVEVGEGAKIGGGSVVLTDIPPHCTATGVPAHVVGHPREDQPALQMDHRIAEDEE